MNNNRRQFIKKSFLAGLLGVFAPSLIKIEKQRHFYIQDGPFFHNCFELNYCSFYGKNNDFLTFEVTDPKNILFYDKTQKGIFKWRKVKNFYCENYNTGYKKDNRIEFELA